MKNNNRAFDQDQDQEKDQESGSIDLIVLGLLCALVVVLCIPVLTSLGNTVEKTLNYTDQELLNALPDEVKK